MGGIASILVVDDNPKFLADALPMYGYDVTVALDGLEALKVLAKEDAYFDLVLLDGMMPNMDGWDTLKAIRKKLKGLSKNEIEERLNFYSEIIEDKKEEGATEEEAIKELAIINGIDEQFLNENDTPILETCEKLIGKIKEMEVWKIILIVLGAPIWFSLLVGAFAVVVSLYVSLLAVVISLYASCLALIVSSFGGIIMGIVYLFSNNVIQGFAIIGLSLVCFGLSILLFNLTSLLTKGLIILTKKLIRKGE